jgi:hypothetical protein
MNIMKLRKLALSVFIFCFVVFLWSFYRMEICGYDCGIFTLHSGGATVIYYLLSFWLGLASLATFLGATFYLLKLKAKL